MLALAAPRTASLMSDVHCLRLFASVELYVVCLAPLSISEPLNRGVQNNEIGRQQQQLPYYVNPIS